MPVAVSFVLLWYTVWVGSHRHGLRCVQEVLIVVPDREPRHEDAQDEERLRTGLVLDIVLHRVRQEVPHLEENLRQREKHNRQAEPLLAQAIVDVQRNRELRDVDGSHGDPLRNIDAKLNRQGLQTKLAVPFNALEVIDNGNAEAGNGVEYGQQGDIPREVVAEEKLASPPRQSNVGRTQSVAPYPTRLLQLERGCRVDVRDE
mmetsp:Transcript_11568/g.29445  ORF Transcript_11568/g.29445 Transcript_11568/m.29445 type:complete len:203 (+) Transcript_11568:100-708(+)